MIRYSTGFDIPADYCLRSFCLLRFLPPRFLHFFGIAFFHRNYVEEGFIATVGKFTGFNPADIDYIDIVFAAVVVANQFFFRGCFDVPDVSFGVPPVSGV